MSLSTCTITGVDDVTDALTLKRLLAEYPFAEFALLYSRKMAGVGRYPSWDTFEHLLPLIQDHPGRFALHVCGGTVFDSFLSEGNTGAALPLLAHIGAFGRIQLNFISQDQHDAARVDALCRRYPALHFITQHNIKNQDLSAAITAPNHSVLFDSSGGRGLEPKYLLPPIPGKRCGYSGGIGPDNVVARVQAINEITGGADYWIDMESRLRSPHDRLDIWAVERTLQEVAALLPARP